MNRLRRGVLYAKHSGQAVIVVAIVLPFVVGFALLTVEVAERWLELAMLEDALQHATRSAVQTFEYAELARGGQALRASADCHQVTWDEEPACRPVLEVAHAFLLVNLAGVRGLDEPAEMLAARVRWTVLPKGGTCTFTSSAATPVTESTPLICAEARPVMRGIAGWGQYTPFVVAADTLDLVSP